jgi:magnesium transporter
MMDHSTNDKPKMGVLLAPEIENMLNAKRTREVRAALNDLQLPEIVDILVELDSRHRAIAFRLLPRDVAADAYTELPSDQQLQLQDDLSNEQLAQMFNEMDPDDRADLFDEMPGQLAAQLLGMMRPEERRSTQIILGYPPESIGRLMTPEYLALNPEWTVKESLDHIRRRGRDAETVHILYVVGERGRLLDEIRIRELLLVEPETKISDLMDDSAVALNAHDDREEAVRMMERYDMSVLPVVDRDNVLVGIVTFDDVADVAEVEVTEDIHKGSAVAPLVMGYHETSVASLVKKRAGWLVLLVFINLFSAMVIENYEATLETMIALAFFIPLLIDSGGNTGSQSATIMVRAIATGDVKLRQWASTLGKEVLVGIALGLCVGTAALLLGFFRFGWEIGLIVSVSMVCIILTANLIGTLMPFVLSKLRLDPATASAPLITSIADITGLLIYFGIATYVLNLLEISGNG